MTNPRPFKVQRTRTGRLIMPKEYQVMVRSRGRWGGRRWGCGWCRVAAAQDHGEHALQRTQSLLKARAAANISCREAADVEHAASGGLLLRALHQRHKAEVMYELGEPRTRRLEEAAVLATSCFAS